METQVKFCKFPDGDIIALFPEIEADHSGNIQSYMRVGQHGAASPELLDDLAEANYSEFQFLLAELVGIGYNNLLVTNSQQIELHRNPTPQEINFGHGATHYKEFEIEHCINRKTGKLKAWLVCPHDGLRYYR